MQCSRERKRIAMVTKEAIANRLPTGRILHAPAAIPLHRRHNKRVFTTKTTPTAAERNGPTTGPVIFPGSKRRQGSHRKNGFFGGRSLAAQASIITRSTSEWHALYTMECKDHNTNGTDRIYHFFKLNLWIALSRFSDRGLFW